MKLEEVVGKQKEKQDPKGIAKEVLRYLKRGPASVSELSSRLDRGVTQIKKAIAELEESGYHVEVKAESVEVVRDLPSGGELTIDPKRYRGNEFKFGIASDTHLASKYCRLDVLNALYDIFEREGVKDIFHAGNLVDGHARFNRFDLLATSPEGQIDLAIRDYPQRKGITTHFIVGECHEGWWVQREGIDIGKLIETRFRDAGRNDMKYLGYLEADIRLPAPKGETWVRLMHPGGGSAYALSYAPQKLVECVPLESEILTPTGWKKHNEVAVGDQILGYNVSTGRCEWTALRAINRYNNAEIVEYSNDQFRVRCTRDHRWAMEWQSRGGKNPDSLEPTNYTRKHRVLQTIEESRERSFIIQAAPGPEGEGVAFEEHASIMNRADAIQLVLRMTSAQRQAFIYGMMAGEGTLAGSGNTPVFSQNPGPIQDAFVLACFLEGRATGIARKQTKKINGEEKVCCRTTVLKKPYRMVTRSLRPTGWHEGQEVWCPSTDLGTWVMRQGEVVTITGNSFQGGEKPHALIIGHFHKMEFCMPREVYCVSAGCTQDQTPFMRKLRIEAHVGGWTCKITQAPDGHISSMAVDWHRFYDRKFYSGKEKFKRW